MTNRTSLAPCPVELLVRQDFGREFDRYIHSHNVRRVIASVYVSAPAWQQLAPWQRYLAKVHAVARTHPGLVFVLESAAALHGIGYIGSPNYVHALADYPGAAKVSGSIQRHFYTDFLEPETLEGISLTSVADTAIDIARARHPAFGLATLDDVIRSHGIMQGHLAATNDGRDSSRGRANALWSIERATGIPESVLESLSIAEIEWLGFARPMLQKEFDLGQLGKKRVDTYWPDVNVIGEADGDSKYRLHPGGVGAALVEEKRREDALRRLSDGFARWGWADCRDPQLLEQILLDERIPRVRSRNNTRLRTLVAHLNG